VGFPRGDRLDAICSSLLHRSKCGKSWSRTSACQFPLVVIGAGSSPLVTRVQIPVAALLLSVTPGDFVLKFFLGYPDVGNFDGSWTEWGILSAPRLRNSKGRPSEIGFPRVPKLKEKREEKTDSGFRVPHSKKGEELCPSKKISQTYLRYSYREST
jgi:hypothetical protein